VSDHDLERPEPDRVRLLHTLLRHARDESLQTRASLLAERHQVGLGRGSHRFGDGHDQRRFTGLARRSEVNRWIVDGTVDTLKGSEKVVEAIFEQRVPDVDGLADDPRVRRIERSGRILRAYVKDDSDGIARRLNEFSPKNVSVLDLNLEDIFINAVGGEIPMVGGEVS